MDRQKAMYFGADRFYSLYAAHLIRSYTRDGKSFVDDEWHLPNRWKPRTIWPKSHHEDCGCAKISMNKIMNGYI